MAPAHSEPNANGRSVASRPALLATKLYIPRVRAGLVPRPRLTRRLDEGLQHKLTLVSAPAGFGKSTLMAEWAHLWAAAQPPLPVAWLSLDAGDSDPVRFWAYLTEALHRVQPGTGQDMLAHLRSPQPPPIEALLSQLINDIASIPVDFALVLDDYHAISAQPIHDALAFLLQHLPPQMHLFLASRSDPPLPLARLRGRGELLELRANDLRFSTDEAAEFLNRAMGLTLSPEDIAALDAHTEGWVAGLQLAALSMQGSSDPSGLIRTFGGGHRHVLDYLAQEILDRQPEATRTFLLQTAILERLSGPLCEAVVGVGDGQATLERLEQANLFIVPLDQERRWYRYHHLFAEFLRNRLAQTQPDAAPGLHRRASAWHAQHGLLTEAVDHALAARAFDEAADLIERAAEDAFRQSELSTLRRWIEALPAGVRARPRLAMIQAWTLLATGSFEAVELLLQGIERGLRDAGTGDEVRGALGEVAVARAVMAMNGLKLQETVALCQQARSYLAGLERGLFNSALALRGAAAFELGLAHEFSGEVPAASEAFGEAAELSRQAGNLHIAPMALSRLANLQVVCGQLRRAAKTYQQALRLTQEMTERPSPMSGQVFAGFGDLCREQNDLEAARHYLERGIELGHQWANVETLAGGYIGLARLRQACGDTQSGLQALDELATIVERPQVPWMPPLIQACRVRLWAALGRLDELAHWLQTHGFATDDAPSVLREVEHIALARALMALDRRREALALLGHLRQAAVAGGRQGHAIEILAPKPKSWPTVWPSCWQARSSPPARPAT